MRIVPISLILMACTDGITAVPKDTQSGTAHDSRYDSDSWGESGGGGGGGGGGGNTAPVANAGPDQTTSPSQLVLLDGSGSHDADGDTLNYAWTFTDKPNGSNVSLLNDDRVDPQFFPDKAGVYRIELVVDDGTTLSSPDTIEVTASEENGTPIANAGPDQSVSTGANVVLDGNGSSDPEGQSLRFAWTLTTVPSGSSATLANSTTATPRFVADVAGTYQVSLIVSDGTESSNPDTVRITASDGGGGGSGGGGGGSSTCGCDASSSGMLSMLTALGALTVPLLRRRSR